MGREGLTRGLTIVFSYRRRGIYIIATVQGWCKGLDGGLTVSFGHHLPISGGVAGVCWSCGVVRVWSRTAVEAVQVWRSGELAVCSSFHRFSLVLDCPVMHAGSGRDRIDVSACCGMWGQTVSWFYGKRYMGYVVGGARVVLIATVHSITLCARLLLPVRGEQLLATPLSGSGYPHGTGKGMGALVSFCERQVRALWGLCVKCCGAGWRWWWQWRWQWLEILAGLPVGRRVGTHTHTERERHEKDASRRSMTGKRRSRQETWGRGPLLVQAA